MKIYIYTNIYNSNIEIRILANNFTEASEILLSITRDFEEFRLND